MILDRPIGYSKLLVLFYYDADMDQDFTKGRPKDVLLPTQIYFIDWSENATASNRFGIAIQVLVRNYVNAYSIRSVGLNASLDSWDQNSRVRKTYLWWVSPRSNVAKSVGTDGEESRCVITKLFM